MTRPVEDATAESRLRQALGFAGLLPFANCLALILLSNDPGQRAAVTSALLNYSAVIASFLGAVHWGATMCQRSTRRASHLLWGITPALVAWLLLILPVDIALAGFIALFAIALLIDRWLLPLPDPAYRQLRLQLSLVVIASLSVTAAVLPRTPA